MEKENKYYCVSNRTLATALNFVGFSYMKFNDEDNNNQTSYSFVNSEEFQEALNVLNELRRKNNKYKK